MKLYPLPKRLNMLPEEELKPKVANHFAPMIDFLFIMLALFATLALSRATLYDSTIDLSKVSNQKTSPTTPTLAQVNLSIDANGKYNWLAEFSSYPMESLDAIKKEVIYQYEQGLLPKEKKDVEVLLHIDKKAPWDPVAQLILLMKELNFDVKPLYESSEP